MPFYVIVEQGKPPKDNLGILYPFQKNVVESSPRRKLPSIPEHNSMEEDEGKFLASVLKV